MAREKTQLDLQAELPEVRSTDFNLFYKPDVAPRDKSIDVFTQSLDSFVNGAGTGLALRAEQEEKDINEADAEAQFNKNRTGFNKAVERGEIPKEANPYFQEKYKELTLNKKAREFQAEMYRKFADPENNVLENPDPNAFDKFYNDGLKEFVEKNQLGVFDPLLLEKGFFSETSKTRNSLFNTHLQSQMSKIGEDYKLGFKENIQGKFDKSKSNEEIGADISGFIQDAVTNGLGKSTARKYLLESLKEYAETTADLEFAERLLRDLPNHLKLGTDALGNVKGIQNDLDALKEKIDDRIFQKEKDDNQRLRLEESNDKLEASEFTNKYDTFSEAILDPEYQNFSKNKQAEIFKEFEVREQGFDSQTDPRVEEDFYKLLEENKISEAKEFLRRNIPNMTSNDYSEFDTELKAFQFTQKDGLLASGYYKHWKNEIEGITKSTNKSKFALSKISPLEHKKFEANMKVWLKDNPVENYEKPSDRKEAFEKYVKTEYDKVLEIAISDEASFTDGDVSISGNDDTPTIEGGKIKANKEDLKVTIEEEPKVKLNRKKRRDTKPEDPELSMDMSSVVIIPEGLSGTKLRKFRRDNPNAISRDKYDRIVQKQTSNQTAKIGGSS